LPPSRKGKPLNCSTVFRWIVKGVRGIRLEAARLGGQWFTSREALQRFAERLTAQALPTAVDEVRTPAEMSRAADQASLRLERRGA
jgi:hypothetical protein